MPKFKRIYIVLACVLAIAVAGGSLLMETRVLAEGGQSAAGGGCSMGGGQGCGGGGCSMMGGGGAKGCSMMSGAKSGCALPAGLKPDPKATREITGTIAQIAADGASATLSTHDGPRLVLLCATPPTPDGKPALKVGDRVTLVTALVALSVKLPAGAAKPAAAATYVCPMHPDVTGAKPGSCPKCGMDLVKRG